MPHILRVFLAPLWFSFLVFILARSKSNPHDHITSSTISTDDDGRHAKEPIGILFCDFRQNCRTIQECLVTRIAYRFVYFLFVIHLSIALCFCPDCSSDKEPGVAGCAVGATRDRQLLLAMKLVASCGRILVKSILHECV